MHIASHDQGLHGSCIEGSIEKVRHFIARGEAFIEDSVSAAFYWANVHGDAELITCINDLIKPDWVVSCRNAALRGACRGGHHDAINTILAAGPTDPDHGLFGAARGGHMDLVVTMMARGAKNYDTAMYHAARGGHLQIIKAFIDQFKGHIDAWLEYACRGGHIHLAKWLIAHGANPKTVGYKDLCRSGSIELIELVMAEHGANINANYCLLNGIEYGHSSLVEYAISHGATDFDHGLEKACSVGSMPFALRMLECGVSQFHAPLEQAVEWYYWDLVELMTKKCREAELADSD